MRDTDTPPRRDRPGLLARLMRLDRSYRQRHRLAQLSDHLLQDIGVDPSHIRKDPRR